MNVDLINKAVDAAVEAMKVVDGSKTDGTKTTLFSGTIESENGVRTIKSVSGDIVSENDVNAFFDRIGMIAKTVVYAINAAKEEDKAEREAREAEAKAEAKRVAEEAEAKANEADEAVKAAKAKAQSLRTEADEAAREVENPFYRRPTIKRYKKVLVEDND